MSAVGSVCVVIRRPPLGGRDTIEVLRLALALLTGDLDYRLILKGDGVFHALASLPERTPYHRETSRGLMEDSIGFDVPVYAVAEDLRARVLGENDLLDMVQVVDTEGSMNMIAQADATWYL